MIGPNYSQKERQQAVVWLAQDAYIGLLGEVQDLADQLKLVTIWRDITKCLGNVDGVARIHDLLLGELGEEGPLLLG